MFSLKKVHKQYVHQAVCKIAKHENNTKKAKERRNCGYSFHWTFCFFFYINLTNLLTDSTSLCLPGKLALEEEAFGGLLVDLYLRTFVFLSSPPEPVPLFGALFMVMQALSCVIYTCIFFLLEALSMNVCVPLFICLKKKKRCKQQMMFNGNSL